MKHLLAYILLTACILSFTCCRGNDSEPVLLPSEQDIVVCHNDTQTIWLSGHTYRNIILGSQDPKRLISQPWTIPTKSIAYTLHQMHIDNGGDKTRYLCIDDAGTYYTFQFSGIGSITKAGFKTAYCLRPIRVTNYPKDTIIQL